MLAACKEQGLKVVLTMHHFTSPRWLAARGGWESRDTARLFARYCEQAVAYLGDLIDVACTLNELNLGILLRQWGFLHIDDAILNSPWRVAAAQACGVEPNQVGRGASRIARSIGVSWLRNSFMSILIQT
jgi:beta-glucosidase